MNKVLIELFTHSCNTTLVPVGEEDFLEFLVCVIVFLPAYDLGNASLALRFCSSMESTIFLLKKFPWTIIFNILEGGISQLRSPISKCR